MSCLITNNYNNHQTVNSIADNEIKNLNRIVGGISIAVISTFVLKALGFKGTALSIAFTASVSITVFTVIGVGASLFLLSRLQAISKDLAKI